jgi:hypothetical protein
MYAYNQGSTNCPKARSHLKILGAWRVTQKDASKKKSATVKYLFIPASNAGSGRSHSHVQCFCCYTVNKTVLQYYVDWEEWGTGGGQNEKAPRNVLPQYLSRATVKDLEMLATVKLSSQKFRPSCVAISNT